MKQFVRDHAFIIALGVLFFGLNAWAIGSWYSYQLNPDGLSYITIAEKYARLDIKDAINGYWGPVMSLALVPFVWIGADMIIAGKLVTLIAATIILGVLYWALLRYKVSRAITYGTTFTAAVLLSEWGTYGPITPDMIMALWTILLALGLLEFMRKPTRKLGIMLGILGALMYYTKGFGLYFFVALIGLVALWQWWYREGRDHKKVLRRYAPMAIVFAILVLPFIGVLSVKYQKLTINNAGTFNWRVMGPHLNGVQPMDNFGPFIPPNDTAVNAWEDGSRVTDPSQDWGLLDSKQNLIHYLNKILWVNFNNVFSIMRGFGAYASFAMVILIIGCFQRKYFQREYIVFTLINGLLIVGYGVLFLDGRYIWGGTLLAFIATALFLSTLQKKQLLSTLQLTVGGVLVGGGLLLTVVQGIVGSRDLGEDLYRISKVVDPLIPEGAHVMADRNNPAYPVCYRIKAQCYNVMNPSIDNADDYYRLIKREGVSYYLDFHMREDDAALQSFVSRYGSMLEDHTIKGQRVTIYKIN
ncbi:MAG TPA: hypothetical protein VD735_01735 [Candidatus Saccharimonadales bacterium]|nr:hypothetical protein [Candidatus Saccharimonadales bacterium]